MEKKTINANIDADNFAANQIRFETLDKLNIRFEVYKVMAWNNSDEPIDYEQQSIAVVKWDGCINIKYKVSHFCDLEEINNFHSAFETGYKECIRILEELENDN